MTSYGVVNQKGGVGKTTTAVNLSVGLALKGENVLLIDCDPQGNATTGLGIEKSKIESSIVDLLVATSEDNLTDESVNKSILHLEFGLDIIPSVTELAVLDQSLATSIGRETLLRTLVEKLGDRYQWIILDSPPSLGFMTINVLCASNQVIVPLQSEFYSLEGISQLLKTIQLVQKRINPQLKIGKVVLTMHDPRSKSAQQIHHEVANYFGDILAKTVIPRNVRLSEAPSFGEPALLRFPSSKGAIAYQDLLKEVFV